jgi:ferredoxin
VSSETPIHYVSTREEFSEILRKHDRFWVSNCGCREGREGGCKRSRMDICLMFTADQNSSGTGKREATRADVDAIMREAEEKRLVVRPFRTEDRQDTDGACFCCDDCCGYFLAPEQKCDKGAFIETTKLDECSDCGACVDVCYFKARTMADDRLRVDREKCFGCGLCRDVCPTGCVEMTVRP